MKKKEKKENKRIRNLLWTLNCLIRGRVYSRRGPGEAGPPGPEGFPYRPAYHKMGWQLLHHPACPEFSLLQIGWAVARGRGQLARDNYSGLATLKHWLPCNSNYFSDSSLGLFLILFWITCAREKKKNKKEEFISKPTLRGLRKSDNPNLLTK